MNGPNPRMVPTWHGLDRTAFDHARADAHKRLTAAALAVAGWPPEPKLVLVPTVNLANLVYRAVRAGKTRYNYCAAIVRDASGGIYIQLGWADWVRPGDTYVNPHTRT